MLLQKYLPLGFEMLVEIMRLIVYDFEMIGLQ